MLLKQQWKCLDQKITKDIYTLYHQAFPIDEQRPTEVQKLMLNHPQYTANYFLNKQKELAAILFWWNLNKYTYIEHFAVSPKLRSKGIGTQILHDFKNQASNTIILEVDPPSDTNTIRRIEFYKRLNFKLNDVKYIQPPLSKNGNEVELKLMSFPKIINTTDKNDFCHLYNSIAKFKEI